jgi:hypothetical protein
MLENVKGGDQMRDLGISWREALNVSKRNRV